MRIRSAVKPLNPNPYTLNPKPNKNALQPRTLPPFSSSALSGVLLAVGRQPVSFMCHGQGFRILGLGV